VVVFSENYFAITFFFGGTLIRANVWNLWCGNAWNLSDLDRFFEVMAADI
jgi:hypothetical protein